MVTAAALNAPGEEDEQEATRSVAAANEIYLQPATVLSLLGNNIWPKEKPAAVKFFWVDSVVSLSHRHVFTRDK